MYECSISFLSRFKIAARNFGICNETRCEETFTANLIIIEVIFMDGRVRYKRCVSLFLLQYNLPRILNDKAVPKCILQYGAF
jgi:hypothetical protein